MRNERLSLLVLIGSLMLTPAAFADATLQWFYAGVAYPTQAAALAAMRAVPGNGLLTQSIGATNMTTGTVQYKYTVPTLQVTPVTQYYGNGVWEPSEAAAAASAATYFFNYDNCGSETATPTGDWIFVPMIQTPVWGPGYTRNYTITYWTWNYYTNICTPIPNNAWVMYQETVESCPTGYMVSGSSCINNTVDYVYSTPLECPLCLAPGSLTLRGDPVDVASGEFTQTETDYAGPALAFRRYYHSSTLDAYHGMGVGWTHQYAAQLVISGGAPVGLARPEGYHDPLVWSSGSSSYESTSGASIHVQATSSNWTAYLADGSQEVYNAAGSLIELVSPTGMITTLTYTGSALTSIIAPFGQTLQISYNASNLIGQVTDPAGKTIQYAYDASGNLSSVTYPDGKTRVYAYENASYPHNLTGTTDESAIRFSTITYDANGRASSASDAGGANGVTVSYSATSATVTDGLTGTTVFGFVVPANYTPRVTSVAHNGLTRSYVVPSPSVDPQQRPTQMKDELGNLTNYVYDVDHLTSKSEAVGTAVARTTGYMYLATTSALPTLITEALRTTAYAYYAGTNEVHTKTVTDTTVTPNVSRTWTYTYDGYGRVLTIDGPRTDLTDVTTYAYYTCTTGAQCGLVNTITDALGNVTTYNTYNAHGQPLTITDPNGTVTTLTYDLRQRLTSRQVGTELTSFAYYPTGLLQKATLPDNSYVQYTYDPAHRLTQIADGAGNAIKYTLDYMGNQTAESAYDPSNVLSRTRTRVFNTLNQLYQEIGAANTAAVTTTLGYDANGNQNAINAPLARNTTNAYDELNRLKQVTDPKSGITKYAYDANDNLTQVTDPRNLLTSYQYTGFGDVKQLTSPDTGVTTNTYDSGGNLATATDARSAISTYTYDALNRVKTVAYKIGSTTDQTITYTYDAGTHGKGRLTGASDANHSMTWTYDSLGRVASKKQTQGSVNQTVGYVYTNGDLTTLTTPSGQTVVYSYSNNQVTGITINGTTLLSGVAYEPFGPARGWTWGNGTAEVRLHNTDGNPSQVSAVEASSYSYDNAFRITGITNSSNSALSWTYGYDLLDRLTSASKTGTTQGWTYDANGNRLTQTGTVTGTYTPSTTSNRLNSITGTPARTYTYSNSGSTLTYASNTFTYYNSGRMKTVKVGSSTTTYVYSALGQRIKKSGGSAGTVLTVFDETGHLLGEYSSTGALVQETVWLGDTPVATIRPGSPAIVYYVHADHLNAPRMVTQSIVSGKIAWRWDTDPFGTPAPNQNPGGLGTFVYNLRYPGQYFDTETGLNYNYFRDYDPATGRYAESDPIGLKGGINTYAYVADNPLSYSDPRGLAKCKCRESQGGGQRATPPPGFSGMMPKICTYKCSCDCNPAPITIQYSAGPGSSATCIGQIDPHYTQPGQTTSFESFSFDTTSIIDRYVNPLAPPIGFMDLVDKQCTGCAK